MASDKTDPPQQLGQDTGTMINESLQRALMAMHVSMGQANHPHPRRMTGEEIIEEYLRDIGYVNNLASRSQHQLASTLPQSGEMQNISMENYNELEHYEDEEEDDELEYTEDESHDDTTDEEESINDGVQFSVDGVLHSTAPSQPVLGPQSLTRFMDFPFEIRSLIWDLAQDNSPRNVKVHYDRVIGKFYTSTPSPVHLRVCLESRGIAKRTWTLHFGTLGHPASVRANLEIDNIQIDWVPLRLNVMRDMLDLTNIRFLELRISELQLPDTKRITRELQRFTSLEEVTIATPPPPQPYLAHELTLIEAGQTKKYDWRLVGAHFAYRMRYREICGLFRAVRACMEEFRKRDQNWKVVPVNVVGTELGLDWA